jgi:hypothetical protein
MNAGNADSANIPSDGIDETEYRSTTASAPPAGPAVEPGLPQIGNNVEGYRIEELMHIGSMTAVYLGAAEATGVRSTVLICRPRSSVAFRRSFELSRNFQAKIDNPAVARIIGGGMWNTDLPVTIRQYIPGKTCLAYLAVAGSFPAPVCSAITGSIVKILAEIADCVEESRWAGFFHRCLWRIGPGDVVITPRGRLHLITHGIDHHFDVRLHRRPAGASDPPPYSPTMDCTTVIHSVGALLLSMIDGTDSLHSSATTPATGNRDMKLLRAIALKCGVAGIDIEEKPSVFTSLFEVRDALHKLPFRPARDDCANVIAAYFTGASGVSP